MSPRFFGRLVSWIARTWRDARAICSLTTLRWLAAAWRTRFVHPEGGFLFHWSSLASLDALATGRTEEWGELVSRRPSARVRVVNAFARWVRQ